jgi:hypothetical protein
MADYFTQFSCIFDVGSAENAALAATIYGELAVELDQEEGTDLGFEFEVDLEHGSGALRDPGHRIAGQLGGGRTRHGWFVYAPEDPVIDIPRDLQVVLAEARRRGAEYVLLDCDAVPDQDLPVLHPEFFDGA